MAFNKDAKIRGNDLKESYTVYNTENEKHLFFNTRLDSYAWDYKDDGDVFQIFDNKEIDLIISVIQSLVEIADAMPLRNLEEQIAEELLSKYTVGGKLKGVVKIVIDSGYKRIRIIPGRIKAPHFDEAGKISVMWIPDFINEIRI